MPPDRRRDDRYLTILRVGTLIVEGRRELCLLRNISASGAMLHVYQQIHVGVPIQIEIKNDEPLSAKVVWTAEPNIGVVFDQRIDVPELLATSRILGDGRSARRPRIEIDCAANLRCGDRLLEGRVRNISQGGIRFDCNHYDLAAEMGVVVTMAGFRPVAGVIRWGREGCYGISFFQVISVQELCEWLRSH